MVREQPSDVHDHGIGINVLVGFGAIDALSTLRLLAQKALRRPKLAVKHGAGFLGDVGSVLLGRRRIDPDPKDARFQDPTWRLNVFYRLVMSAYLAGYDRLDRFIEDAGFSRTDSARARFALMLIWQSLAPTNTLLGNPQALKKLLETGGTSLARGLRHMYQDIARGAWLPAQVDFSAFEVGKNIAVSTGAVVFRNELLEILQYEPLTKSVRERPLLVVPPQVNKFYVFDLSPEKSLFRYLLGQGIPVFTISWRSPAKTEANWSLESYVGAILEALDAVREISGSASINVFAACSGGVTATAMMAYLGARKETRVHSLSLVVTVLDGLEETQVGLFASPGSVAVAKRLSRAKGVLAGQSMARFFAWLRPNDLIWNYWVNSYLLGEKPPAFDILYWNNDVTNLPSALHGELLDLYLERWFVTPGKCVIKGVPVDVGSIEVDSYVVAGVTDHITPWTSCYNTTQLLGGKCEFVLSNSGHIQSILSAPGNPKASYHVGDGKYPHDPKQWLSATEKRTGSWWEHWLKWLHGHSGEVRPAPAKLGSEKHPPMVPAPGTYAVEKR